MLWLPTATLEALEILIYGSIRALKTPNAYYGALKSFGAPLQGLEATDFQKPGLVFQIGIVPRRIDILTQISGIEEFEPAWNRREDFQLEGITIPVLSRSDFKTNKLAIGRPKDLADIAWVDSLE